MRGGCAVSWCIGLYPPVVPRSQLGACQQIAVQLFRNLAKSREIETWAVGFSIFVPPWDQSRRAYCGWVRGRELIDAAEAPLGYIRDSYSNIRQINEILKRLR